VAHRGGSKPFVKDVEFVLPPDETVQGTHKVNVPVWAGRTGSC
jgi:hypothetical protein